MAKKSTKRKKPKANVVTTRAEAAKILKERLGKGSVRTLADWLKLGCPGEPGRYPVDEIEQWVRDNVDVEEGGEDKDGRAFWSAYKLREQALTAEYSRKQLEGRLVDVDEVTRLMERMAAEVTALLDQLPDWCLTLLPAKTPAKQKRSVREAVGRKVDDMRSTIANTLEEWADRS